MDIEEFSNLVVWYCFDKVEPCTKITLNCYLFLMNRYSLKTFGEPLTPDIRFSYDRDYPYISGTWYDYFPGEILPTGERPSAKIPGELRWFLDGLVDFNKKNPFKILADCKRLKKSFADVYKELVSEG